MQISGPLKDHPFLDIFEIWLLITVKIMITLPRRSRYRFSPNVYGRYLTVALLATDRPQPLRTFKKLFNGL